MEDLDNIAICCACNIERGYITMNCATHKEKKMYCAQCWTDKGAPLMCIEQGCGKQVHVKYETVKLMTWEEHVQRMRDFFYSEFTFVMCIFFVTVFLLFLPIFVKSPFVKIGTDGLINDNLAGFVFIEVYIYMLIVIIACALFMVALDNNKNNPDSVKMPEPHYHLYFLTAFKFKPELSSTLKTREIAMLELLLRFLCLYVLSMTGWFYAFVFPLSFAAWLDVLGTFLFFAWCCYLYRIEFNFIGSVYRVSFWTALERLFYTRSTVIL